MTELFQPEVRASLNGQLNTSLRVFKADNEIGDASVHLRSYEGRLLGPTFRIKAGDTLNVTLVNDI